MQHYEALFIFRADLPEEQLSALRRTIEETIAAEGGQVEQQQAWGRRRLAYPIRKHHDGFYHLCEFQVKTEAIDRLRRSFQLNEAMLRVMVVRRDAPAVAASTPGRSREAMTSGTQ